MQALLQVHCTLQPKSHLTHDQILLENDLFKLLLQQYYQELTIHEFLDDRNFFIRQSVRPIDWIHRVYILLSKIWGSAFLNLFPKLQVCFLACQFLKQRQLKISKMRMLRVSRIWIQLKLLIIVYTRLSPKQRYHHQSSIQEFNHLICLKKLWILSPNYVGQQLYRLAFLPHYG